MLPKMHKTDTPGRPIIASNDTITENVSSIVDLLIKDPSSTFPSCVKDTNHILEIISNITVPQDTLLVILDVTSLYTNIPLAEGVQAMISSYMKGNK